MSELAANTLRTRGVIFATLFGPPRFVAREEASRAYGELCDRLGNDDFSFQYNSGESTRGTSRGFAFSCERKEGRGAYSITVENPAIDHPMRLLMEYRWPMSPGHITEYMDITSKAVFDTLEGDWTAIMSEVKIQADCGVRDGTGLQFISENVLKAGGADSLGENIPHVSVKYEIPAQFATDPAIQEPRREVTIEPLREDGKSVYIELMCQWASMPRIVESQPGAIAVEPSSLDGTPRVLIDRTNEYLRKSVLGIGTND